MCNCWRGGTRVDIIWYFFSTIRYHYQIYGKCKRWTFHILCGFMKRFISAAHISLHIWSLNSEQMTLFRLLQQSSYLRICVALMAHEIWSGSKSIEFGYILKTRTWRHILIKFQLLLNIMSTFQTWWNGARMYGISHFTAHKVHFV